MKVPDMKIKTIVMSIISLLIVVPVYANELTVIDVVGHGAVIGENNTVRNVKTGDTVLAGNKVIVFGKGVVHLASQGELIVFKADNEAIFEYDESDSIGKIHLKMTKGQMSFTVVPGNKIDIKTPHMVASVRGTEFTLDVDKEDTSLFVDKGSVQATDNKGKTMAVNKGFAMKSTGAAFTRGKPVEQKILKNENAMENRATNNKDGAKKENSDNHDGNANENSDNRDGNANENSDKRDGNANENSDNGKKK